MNRPALIHPQLMPTILNRDQIRVWRSTTKVDSEGGTNEGFYEITSQLPAPYGAWGKPTDQDTLVAQQRGDIVNAVLLTLPQDIRPGDHVLVLTVTYEVVAVEPTFAYMRLKLREVVPEP